VDEDVIEQKEGVTGESSCM